MTKLLITSNLHLCSKDNTYSITDENRINTLKKIIIMAKKFDILVLGGDFFHGKYFESEVLIKTINLLNILKKYKTQIIFLPGENELCCEELMQKLSDIDNFIILDKDYSGDIYSFQSQDGDLINFYGSSSISYNAVTQISKNEDTESFHCGIFYSDIDSLENPAESAVAQLQNRSDILDFYIMSHSHNLKIYKYKGTIFGASCGSPESVFAGETGGRYVLSATIKNKSIHEVKRLKVNTIQTDDIHIDCSNYFSSEELSSVIMQKYHEKISLLIYLDGERNFIINKDFHNLLKKNFLNYNIIDNSIPTLEIFHEESSNCKGVKKEFIDNIYNNYSSQADIDEYCLVKLLKHIDSFNREEAEEWLCSLIN